MKFNRIISILLCVLITFTSTGLTVFASENGMVTVNVVKDTSYSLPATVNGMSVSWSPATVDTSKLGYRYYTGTLADSSTVTYKINVGEKVTVANADFENVDIAVNGTSQTSGFALHDNLLLYKPEYAIVNYASKITEIDGNKVWSLGDKNSFATVDSGVNNLIVFNNMSATAGNTISLKTKLDGIKLDRVDNDDIGLVVTWAGCPLYNFRIYASESAPGEWVLMNDYYFDIYAYSSDGNTDVSVKNVVETTVENSKLSTDWFTIEIDVLEGSKYNLRVNGLTVVDGLRFVAGSEITGLEFRKRAAANNGEGAIYIDDIAVSGTRYVSDDVSSVTTNVSLQMGAEASNQTTVALNMTDGTTKNFTVSYTADTSVEGIFTADGTIEGFDDKIQVSYTVVSSERTINALVGETVTLADGSTLVTEKVGQLKRTVTTNTGTVNYVINVGEKTTVAEADFENVDIEAVGTSQVYDYELHENLLFSKPAYNTINCASKIIELDGNKVWSLGDKDSVATVDSGVNNVINLRNITARAGNTISLKTKLDGIKLDRVDNDEIGLVVASGCPLYNFRIYAEQDASGEWKLWEPHFLMYTYSTSGNVSESILDVVTPTVVNSKLSTDWMTIEIDVLADAKYNLRVNDKTIATGLPFVAGSEINSLEFRKKGDLNNGEGAIYIDDIVVNSTRYVNDDISTKVVTKSLAKNSAAAQQTVVTLNMSDGTNKDFDVSYTANTSAEGTFTAEGTVEGFDDKITVRYTVFEQVVVSASELIGAGTTYTLPDSYNGLGVDWGEQETTVNTRYIGIQEFVGTLSDGSLFELEVVVADSKVLFDEDMESYTVGGENPNYELYDSMGGTYLGDAGSIVYENGTSGNKVAKLVNSAAGTSDWGGFDMVVPEVSTTDYIITGRMKYDSGSPTDAHMLMIVYNEVVGGPLQEVAGLMFEIDPPLEIGNAVNDTVNKNPAMLQSSTYIDSYSGEWVDFKIAMDETNDKYDVYVNGVEVVKGSPLNFNNITDASAKQIRIKKYDQSSNAAYFDDMKIVEYRYVTDELPEKLYDSVLSGVDANRSQTISLEMNDGSTREFEVKYTIDPNPIVSGVQTVEGTIDGFTEKIPVEVNVDSRAIQSIKAESLANQSIVYTGSSYTLPSTVVAIMDSADENGGNEKEINIIWIGVADTSVPGTYTFNGEIEGYSEPIVFRLVVTNDAPASLATISETVSLNESYKLPQFVDVTLLSGEIASMEVNWQGNVARTEVPGTYTYSGYLIGYPPIGNDPGFQVTLSLTVTPSAIKAVNYGDGNNEFNILVKNVDELPQKVNCVYENGNTGYERVIWDTSAVTVTPGPHTITGTLENTYLADGFNGTVNAVVSFYMVPEPTVEDGLDTHMWDVPYGGYKFTVGMALRTEQYPTGNTRSFTCAEDPTNPGNKVIKYENHPRYGLNDVKQYGAIELATMREDGSYISEYKEGVLVYESKMYLPYEFSRVRARILTGLNREICQFEVVSDGTLEFSGYESTDSVEKAVPLGEWFKVTIITDCSAKNEADWNFDMYVNGILIKDNAPWYAKPNDTNGISTHGVRRIDWCNQEDDEFIMYLDDVKLYFLSDMLEDAYIAVNSIPTVVTSDNIQLPATAGGANITWQSSDESIITNAGIVTRPEYNQSNKNVTLTATITKDAGALVAKDIVEKTVNVRRKSMTDAVSVAAAKNALSVPASTSEDISLPSTFGNATITWSSDNTNVVDNAGRIYPVDSDTAVQLTATITCGNASDTKVFTVTVLRVPTMSDILKIRDAMRAVSIPTTTSSSITLPKTYNDVTIVWTSNNLSVIKSDGTVVANRPSSSVVSFTAIFLIGDKRDTKTYTITVTNPTTPSGGGGGGGGGGAASSESSGLSENMKSDYIQTTLPKEDTPIQSISKFVDIENYTWAKDSIEALYDLGIVKGVSENEFAPAESVKREEFAAMMVRLAKIELVEMDSPFVDVSQNDWFMNELNTAFANGIINGIGEDTFGAGQNITRQDMAVILCNLAKRYGIIAEAAEASAFEDYSNVSDYAKSAIDFLSEKGVINGSDGMVLPRRMATRAEAAKMIHKFIETFDITNLEFVH